MLGFESDRERAALASFTGEYARVGAVRVPGHFDEPSNDEVLVQGTAPTFLAELAALEAAGVTVGTTIDSVTTVTGRTRGPFKVVQWMPDEDGAFIMLGLQVL